VTAADVIAASSGVAVGIEVLDSRYRDYRFTMADVVADNTSVGRFVIGTPVPTAGIDLRLVGVVLEKNGEVIATASGAASLGHPAAAVAWMGEPPTQQSWAERLRAHARGDWSPSGCRRVCHGQTAVGSRVPGVREPALTPRRGSGGRTGVAPGDKCQVSRRTGRARATAWIPARSSGTIGARHRAAQRRRWLGCRDLCRRTGRP